MGAPRESRSATSALDRICAGLAAKLSALERVEAQGASGDWSAANFHWDDFPRRSAFFVGALREWVSLPKALLAEVMDTVLEWSRPPFSVADKMRVAASRLSRSEDFGLCEAVWSRCCADVVAHALRYGAYGRDPAGLFEVALLHIGALEASAAAPAPLSTAGYLSRRVQGSARLQWASVVGELSRINSAFVPHMLVDDVPLVCFFFVDLSSVAVQVSREILARMADRAAVAKLEREERVLRLAVAERVLERLDFVALEARDSKWGALFRDVVVRLFKTAEALAKSEELKAASLGLMLTVLARAPRAFADKEWPTFFTKRVLRHVVEPRKVTHSLELLLRALRPGLARPARAWDALELYCPWLLERALPHDAAVRGRKAIETVFQEVFENRKSRALLVFSGGSLQVAGASSLMLGDEEADEAPLALVLDGRPAEVALATEVSSPADDDSGQQQQQQQQLQQPQSPRAGGAAAAAAGCAGHGLLSLPRELRACEHILLAIGAADLPFLVERALPALLSFSEDVSSKAPMSSANRLVLGARVTWEMLGPGFSVFRQHHCASPVMLEGALALAWTKLPATLDQLHRALGGEALGIAAEPLVPTLLWDGSWWNEAVTAVAAVAGPGPGSAHDFTGERLGYPLAWSDPDRSAAEAWGPMGSLLPATGLLLELQQLAVQHDSFEARPTAFRARNASDKAAAEAQAAAGLAWREQLVQARKSSKNLFQGPGLEALRELTYTTAPVLLCSPVGPAQTDPARIDRALPRASLLLHADWAVAQATSHALQRVVAGARCEVVRYELVRFRAARALARATSLAVGGDRPALVATITYLRQLVLILRLWKHLRAYEEEAKRVAPLPLDWAAGFVELGLALLALPCAEVRMLAHEVLDASGLLWPESSGCAAADALQRGGATEAASWCVLAELCPCQCGGGISGNSGNSGNGGSGSASASTRAAAMRPVPARHGNSAASTSPGDSETKPRSSSGPAATMSSKASYEELFTFAPTRGTGRDDLFMWYQSAPGSTNSNPGSPSPHSPGTGLLTTPALPVARHKARVSGSWGKEDVSRLSGAWRAQLVSTAHALVDDTALRPHLSLAVHNQLLVWLQRLPPPLEDCAALPAALREAVMTLTIATAGSACAPSPHVVEPPADGKEQPAAVGSPGGWPGRLEEPIEKLVHDTWDCVVKASSAGADKEASAALLAALAGQSAHPRCVARLVEMLVSWREQKVREIEGEAPAAAAARPTFGGFLMRARPAEAAAVDLRAQRAKRVPVERTACRVLRLLLAGGRDARSASLPGWQGSLRRAFQLLAELTVAVQASEEHDKVLVLELCKLILESSRSLACELALENPAAEGFVGAVFSRADQCWSRAERRVLWKLLQQVAGYDDLPLFPGAAAPRAAAAAVATTSPLRSNSVSNSAATIRAAASATASAASASAAAAAAAGGSTSASAADVQAQLVLPMAEHEFRELQRMATRAGAAMLRLGPSSLGAVAPRPDHLLWGWMFKDEEEHPGARLMASYLTAHWHAGDVEAAGGGTFAPFVDRWFEEAVAEQQVGPGPQQQQLAAGSPRRADAIFTALATAASAWLLTRGGLALRRRLEPPAVPAVALLALVQLRVGRPALRAAALELADIVHRTCEQDERSWRHLQQGQRQLGAKTLSDGDEDQVLRPVDLHSGAALPSLNATHSALASATSVRQLACDTSRALARSSPQLGPALLAELCARLPDLAGGQLPLAAAAVEAVLPWSKSPAMEVSAEQGEPSTEAGVSGGDHEQPAVSARLQQLPRRSSVDYAGQREPQHGLSLRELWRCGVALFRAGAQPRLELIAPVWRALARHNASVLLAFILGKLTQRSSQSSGGGGGGGGQTPPRDYITPIAAFLLCEVVRAVLDRDPGTALTALTHALDALAPAELVSWHRPPQNARSRGAASPGDWAAAALSRRRGQQEDRNSDEDDEESPAATLVVAQRCVLQAAALCAATDMLQFACLLPRMVALALILCVSDPAPHGAGGSDGGESPEHLVIALVARAVLNERLRSVRRGGDGAHALDAGLVSASALESLAYSDPAEHDGVSLRCAVSAARELCVRLDPRGSLLDSLYQQLLRAALRRFGPSADRGDWRRASLQRCLEVLELLRPQLPGALRVPAVALTTALGASGSGSSSNTGKLSVSPTALVAPHLARDVELIALMRLLHTSLSERLPASVLQAALRLVLELATLGDGNGLSQRPASRGIAAAALTALAVLVTDSEARSRSLTRAVISGSAEAPSSAALAEDGPEPLLVRLVLLLPVEAVDTAMLPVTKVLLDRLRGRVVRAAAAAAAAAKAGARPVAPVTDDGSRRSSNSSNTSSSSSSSVSDALRLYARLVAKADRQGFEDLLVLCAAAQLAGPAGSLAESAAQAALSVNSGSAPMQKAAAAFFGAPRGGEPQLVELLRAAVSALGPARICSSVQALCLQAGQSEPALFAAAFRLLAALLVAEPIKCLSLLGDAVAMAVASEPLTPFKDAVLARNKLLLALHKAQLASADAGAAAALEQRRPSTRVSFQPSRAEMLDTITALLQAEADRVVLAAAATPTLEPPSPAAAASTVLARTESGGALRSEMVGTSISTSGNGNSRSSAVPTSVECYSGGVASFDQSKFPDTRDLTGGNEDASGNGAAASGPHRVTRKLPVAESPARARLFEGVLADPDLCESLDLFLCHEPDESYLWVELARAVLDLRSAAAAQETLDAGGDVAAEVAALLDSNPADVATQLWSRFGAVDALDTVDLDERERERLGRSVAALARDGRAAARWADAFNAFEPALQACFAYLEEQRFLGRFLRSVEYCEAQPQWEWRTTTSGSQDMTTS